MEPSESVADETAPPAEQPAESSIPLEQQATPDLALAPAAAATAAPAAVNADEAASPPSAEEEAAAIDPLPSSEVAPPVHEAAADEVVAEADHAEAHAAGAEAEAHAEVHVEAHAEAHAVTHAEIHAESETHAAIHAEAEVHAETGAHAEAHAETHAEAHAEAEAHAGAASHAEAEVHAVHGLASEENTAAPIASEGAAPGTAYVPADDLTAPQPGAAYVPADDLTEAAPPDQEEGSGADAGSAIAGSGATAATPAGTPRPPVHRVAAIDGVYDKGAFSLPIDPEKDMSLVSGGLPMGLWVMAPDKGQNKGLSKRLAPCCLQREEGEAEGK